MGLSNRRCLNRFFKNNYPKVEYPGSYFLKDTSITRNLIFSIQQFTIMQVWLTAMKGQKVQELIKKENPNIFEQAFQILTQFPYNIQNGMLYR